MSKVKIVGLDLARHVLQVHDADAVGRPVLRKRLRRVGLMCQRDVSEVTGPRCRPRRGLGHGCLPSSRSLNPARNMIRLY